MNSMRMPMLLLLLYIIFLSVIHTRTLLLQMRMGRHDQESSASLASLASRRTSAPAPSYWPLLGLGAFSLLSGALLLHHTDLLMHLRMQLQRPLAMGRYTAMSVPAGESEEGGAFLLNLPGCRIPAMEPRSPEVEGFLYDYDTLSCGDPPPLVESNDTAVFVVREALAAYNLTTASPLSCCYTAMWRYAPDIPIAEWEPELGSGGADLTGPLYDGRAHGNDVRFANTCVPFQDSAFVEDEFVHVQCLSESRLVYEDYHGFVPLRAPRVPGLSGDSLLTNKHALSVLIVGVDAVSRLNFLRTMPRTAALLTDTLDAVSMLGYNKVGDNTFPNVMPLLSGRSVAELASTCWPKSSAHFDACPWVWKQFARFGYVSAFAEDTAWMGLFHYVKWGFVNQPTDYDARPLLYLGEKRLGRGRGSNAKVCIGQRFQIQVLSDYAGKFIRKMKVHRRKFFGYFWGTSLSHDYLNQPDEADALYEHFLLELIDSGALNSTALIFMSDHGLRWGKILSTYQGHLEERLPFMHIVLPSWVRARYPLAMDNLKTNSRRLITVFDLHRTLLQFADLRSLEPARLELEVTRVRMQGTPSRAISLFTPIPDTRTCNEAGIPKHYCACQHLQRMPVNDSAVRNVASFVIDFINGQLQSHPECSPLGLVVVHDAWRGQPLAHVNATNTRFREHEYQVTVRTRPGLALLSATVRHMLDTNSMLVAGSVTRLNAYGRQSWCVADAVLRLLCYCIQS